MILVLTIQWQYRLSNTASKLITFFTFKYQQGESKTHKNTLRLLSYVLHTRRFLGISFTAPQVEKKIQNYAALIRVSKSI